MKRNAKFLCVVVGTMMGLSLLSGCAKKQVVTTGGTTSKADIIIGAVLPMTGDIATFGESSKNALELLKEQVNKDGGVNGSKIDFKYEDDENKPANSPNAASKLIDKYKVVGLIGSVSSKCSIAMGPIATAAKIPMITSTSTNAEVTTKGGEYVFRACFIDPFQGTVLAQFASEDLKGKTAAALYDVGNDYCKGLADNFEIGFKKAGGTLVAKETYNAGDKDFKAQLTKIKGLNPDVILLPDYYNTVGLITKQARDLGIKAIFLGGDGWDSEDLPKVAGDSIEGGYFSNHYSPDSTDAVVVQFKKDYSAKYAGKVPDALAALAYDAGKIMVEALKKANSTDGAKLKDAIKATNAQLVSGKVTYDANRNPIKGAVIIKMVGGKQTFVKTVNPK